MEIKGSKKLCIAIVTNNYTPYRAGVVNSINSFTTELQKNGNKVFIITLDFLGKCHKDPYYVIRIPSIARFMYKKNHMAVPIWHTKKLEEIIKLLKPDIIHTQHPFFLGKSALKVARKCDIPIIFTYHTIYEQYAHYLPVPQIISRPIIKKIATSFCKKVDGVVVPSTYIEHFLYDKNVQTTIEKIPSGILPMFIKPLAQKQEKKMFNLLTVSRFAKEKNIPFLLDVFAIVQSQYPNRFRFTLVGYGKEFEYLKKYAYKKLKLDPNLATFIYNPAKIEIADQYCLSDLFVYASTSETQGLVMVEAMACGCPVIAINGPGQRDFIENGKNGFLIQTKHQMAEKIIELANHNATLQKLKTGANQTGKKYHPTIMTNKLIKFYNQIVTAKNTKNHPNP